MRPHRTRIDPYGAHLHYAHHPDQWATLARRFEMDPDPNAVGLTSIALDSDRSYEPHLIVWVDHAALPDRRALVRTIVHEAVHAGMHLLNHLGHEPRGKDEPTAYLVEWVTGWLLDHTPEAAS